MHVPKGAVPVFRHFIERMEGKEKFKFNTCRGFSYLKVKNK
jgi:hypothetical protein